MSGYVYKQIGVDSNESRLRDDDEFEIESVKMLKKL